MLFSSGDCSDLLSGFREELSVSCYRTTPLLRGNGEGS